MSCQWQRQIKAIEERKRMVAPFVQRTLSENNVGDKRGQKLGSLMRKFLWQGILEGRKDHLVKWDLVSQVFEI
ncbi:hypothetical protein Pyn_38085 [Prunus yedoensis var. nudiflora]|uniref:Uncharacterized protein n=1 Tax=Prunus yedoensis var. nudiflora TaxID=2094558 RepID=A0A314UVM8_PRUYE|nr:hypothetical protein Pyn_20378 [Prunus yedoensis var. nudiflora]PQQ17526.1 hypothetical protein Pyn_38085 [Prunus yedoensis var. nudiflora]